MKRKPPFQNHVVNQFPSIVTSHRTRPSRHDLHWLFARFIPCLDAAILRRSSLLSLPTLPPPLSFREICRPRPQPIRSSAAPVKFTRQVCYTRRARPARGDTRVACFERGRKNILAVAQVQGVSMSGGITA